MILGSYILLMLLSVSRLTGFTADAPCWLRDAAAVDDHVWLLCDTEQIFRSPDKGSTWRASRLPVQPDVKLRAIRFLDSKTGFVAGDRGTLLLTEDGGSSWRLVPLPVEEDLRDLFFIGPSGWLVGYGGAALHSSDRGKTWKPQVTGTSESLESVVFQDRNHGWAVGWNGVILRTSNGGERWQQIRSPAASWTLSDVYFRDLKNGWAVGFLGHMLRTRDGGLTWEAQPTPLSAWFTCVLFDNAGRGWVAAQGSLLVSEDGGESWKAITREETRFFERVVAVGAEIWALGPFGILRRNPAEPEWRKLDTFGSGS